MVSYLVQNSKYAQPRRDCTGKFFSLPVCLPSGCLLIFMLFSAPEASAYLGSASGPSATWPPIQTLLCLLGTLVVSFHIGSSKNLPASGCSCLVVAGIVTVLPFPKTRRAHMSKKEDVGGDSVTWSTWWIPGFGYTLLTLLFLSLKHRILSFSVLPCYKHDFNCPLVSVVWTDCNLFSHLQLLAFLPPSNHSPSDLSLFPFIYKYLSFKTFLNIKNK